MSRRARDAPGVSATAVERALDRAGLAHGRVGEALHANNVSFTDGRRVWVKVARRGDGPAWAAASAELSAARGAAGAGVACVTPAHAGVLDVDGRPGTVWRYTPGERIAPHEWGPRAARAAWRALAPLHRRTAPAGVPGRGRVADKVAYRAAGTAHRGAAERLAVLARDLDDGWDGAGEAVWCHGDFHAGNVIAAPAGMLVCDWESSCSAPVEWDLAGAYTNMVAIGGRADAFDAVAAEVPHDPAVLDAAILSKVLSGISYLLLFDDAADLLDGRMAAFEAALGAGSRPVGLPAHPGR